MNKISCSFCRAQKVKPYFQNTDGQIYHCPRCELKFVYPISTQVLKKIYQKPYFHREKYQNLKQPGYRDYLLDKEIFNHYFLKKLNWIEKLRPQKGNILDIGAAFGHFLKLAQKSGWQAEGCDISSYATTQAKRAKIQLRQGDFLNLPYPAAKFDVVTLFQTLEHTPKPLDVLKKIKRVLKIGGLVVIASPNQKSLVAQLLGRRWFELKPLEHLFYFSPKNLQMLMRQAGFKKIQVKSDALLWLSVEYIVERLSYYLHLSSSFEKKLMQFFKKTNLGRVWLPVILSGMIAVGWKDEKN